MATYYGENNAKVYNVLDVEGNVNYSPMASGDAKGKVLHMYDEFDLADLGAALTDGDFVRICAKLPAGARLLNVVIAQPADATGVIDVGWEANGVDSASVNGIIDGAAQTSAAVVEMTDAYNTTSHFKKFTAETQLVMEVITTFTGEVGVFKVGVTFVLD